MTDYWKILLSKESPYSKDELYFFRDEMTTFGFCLCLMASLLHPSNKKQCHIQPSEIADEFNFDLDEIDTCLTEMEDDGLIICDEDRHGKLYWSLGSSYKGGKI